MSIAYFLLLFLLIYSGFHFYLFFKIKAAFHPGTAAVMGLTSAFLILGLAPIIVRVADSQGFELTARSFAYAGYTWMGFVVLFFFAGIVIDFYRLLICAGRFPSPSLARAQLTPFYAFIVPVSMAVMISIYGFFEAINIKTETLTITTPKLPPNSRIRIAQISDVHIGLIVREERLQRILDKVNEAKPDILVSTGDLLDGEMDNLSAMKDMLKKVNPSYGKFAVTGNHEYFAGIQKSIKFTEEAGFKMLRGEAVSIGDINIAGVDDLTQRNFLMPGKTPEKPMLSKLARQRFTIFLKHRPVVNPETVGLFDLQLSGHTHKGQFFPFSIVTGLFFPYHAGDFNLTQGSYLHVSRGSGTWGPPIRYLAPPEVTIIDLVSQN